MSLFSFQNKIFNKTNYDGKNNPLNTKANEDNSGLLFLEYVTDLRGFDYSTYFGNNALLLNAEIRIPVIRYFYGGFISSDFLRDLQITGFFDVGSSWTGPSPFERKASINTLILKDQGSPFQAQIRNYGSSWLSSFGTGLHTIIMDYYVKFDLAWPIEYDKIGGQRFLLSFGYDF